MKNKAVFVTITTIIALLFAILLTFVSLGTNGYQDAGVFQKWFGKRYEFKTEMPELTAEDLPELSDSKSCIVFESFSGMTIGKIQYVELYYISDENTVEYRLIVDDDFLSDKNNKIEYRYIVRAKESIAHLQVGTWILNNGEEFEEKAPEKYPLYFARPYAKAPLEGVSEKIFE